MDSTRDVFSPLEWALILLKKLYFGGLQDAPEQKLGSADLCLTLGKPWLSERNAISCIDTSWTLLYKNAHMHTRTPYLPTYL